MLFADCVTLVVGTIYFHARTIYVQPNFVDVGYIVCDREYRGEWEAFTLTPTSFGKFAFKTAHGKFLSVLNDGYLFCFSRAAIYWT